MKTNEETHAKDSMEILEEALTICRFGKFHIRLMFVAMLTSSALILILATTSFILPIAECDLKMDNMQKGLLNTAPFIGIISMTMFVCFLTDTFGRRTFIMIGLFGTFFARVLQGCSQTYWHMIVAKFLEGIFCSFCYPGPVVILSELINKNIRERLLLLNSTLMSLHIVWITGLAWALLPQKLDFVIIEGYFELHSWNIYLFVCSLCSLLAGILFYFIPESPKFLLTHGEEDKALEVLKYIYSENTGKDKDSFPIKTLNTSRTTVKDLNKSLKKKIKHGLLDLKLLFKKPLLWPLLYFSGLTFISFFVGWHPQITTIVESYERENNKTDSFCVVMSNYSESLLTKEENLNLMSNISIIEPEVCIAKISGTDTYISNIVFGCINLVSIAICTYLIDYVGLKPLVCLLFLSTSSLLASVYWTSSATVLAGLLSVISGLLQTSLNIVMNVIVRSFPTSLRASATSIILLMGRIATILGSSVFPVMLASGCMMPFGVLSSMLLCLTFLVYFMPNPNNSTASEK